MRTRSPLLVAVLLAACGGGGDSVRGEPDHASTCVPIPVAEGDRHAAVAALAELAWGAMRAGEPERLLFDDLDLQELLSPGAATRIRGRRLHLDRRLDVDGEDIASALASAEYAGICLQGARAEPAGGPIGLTSDGWVFDRMLLIGTRRGGQRVASWIEGVFVYSDIGFRALDLERVEEPRWEHSDLEIAPCDLAIRDDLPEIAR